MEEQRDNFIDEKQLGWFDRNRLLTLGIFLLIIWFSILLLLFLKADEVTKDPCSICAKRHGKEVSCTIGEWRISEAIYYPNQSIKFIKPTDLINTDSIVIKNMTK